MPYCKQIPLHRNYMGHLESPIGPYMNLSSALCNLGNFTGHTEGQTCQKLRNSMKLNNYEQMALH
jgi:hypothetical protein